MIRAEDIPDEVVEEMAIEIADRQGRLRELTWRDLAEWERENFSNDARAYFAAGINAWPGVSEEEYVTWPRGKLMHLILPLPPGKGDA